MSNLGQETNHCDHTLYNDGSKDGSIKNPQELKSLSSQTGGHHYDKQKNESRTLGMYDVGDGTVLKALQPAPRGLRELDFYNQVFCPECDDPCLLELKQFLPTFYGTEEIGKSSFLKLADLTAKFQKPCVADLKMGRVTYDQEATLAKQLSEDAKFPPIKELGFQFSGFMIQDNDKPVHYKKAFCRSLTRDNMASKGLGCFFSPLPECQKKEVIQQLVARLQKIESWFLRQKKFSFIASSLLVVYEGLNLTPPLKDSKHQDGIDMKTTSSAECTPMCDPVCKLSQAELAGSSSSCSSSTSEHDIKCQTNIMSEPITETVSIVKRSFDNENSNQEKSKRRKSDISNLDNGVQESLEEETSCSEILETNPLVTVHLIDFAHAFPANDIDHNVLFGVQKLISCLQELVVK